MALGYMMLLYVLIVLIAALAQTFLYMGQYKDKIIIFLANMVLGIGLSYLAFTSLPTNFTSQRIIAIIWGVLAVIGMILKLTSKEQTSLISKIVLSISIVGSLIQLFI